VAKRYPWLRMWEIWNEPNLQSFLKPNSPKLYVQRLLNPAYVELQALDPRAARVVEMTVVLSFGPRSRALALRLEQLPGRQPAPGLPARPARWLCTEIEVG